MRVLLMGGAGRTATHLLPFLLRESWDQVILGDREGEPLCRMAMDIPSSPLRFRLLDAGDPDCLRRRMEEADLVVNCAGPMGEMEGKVAGVALETGKPYLSLGEGLDGWRQVKPLESKAKESSVPLICGAGASPGLTGVMTLGLTRRFESIKEVGIFICFSGGGYGRGLVEALASSLEVRGGEASSARFPFPPDGRGRPSFSLRHPESASLGQRLGVPVRAWASFTDPSCFTMFYSLAWSWRESHPLYHWLIDLVHLALRRGEGRGPMAVLAVRVRGYRNGELREEAVAVRGDYYSLSAVALYCALRRLAANEIAPGVYSLEGILEWRDLFPLVRDVGAEFFMAEGVSRR